MRTLVVLAHPKLHESRVNRMWKERLQQEPSITVHDLYETYPSEVIDVEQEQQLLLQHDRIVFQFPFYWYSTPSLLKKWQDEVYTYGFGYGSGNQLKGKEYMLAISVGRAEESYRPEGESLYTLDQLLLPLKATVLLTEMRYVEPFVVYHAPRMNDEEITASADRLAAFLTSPAPADALIAK
ncbi:NAD(P)H-dependent oxidoreductase [Paenibacillus sp. OV219]|uniref:NAD(P)H-dependent oxidoreductase n=1 Tax=Paenibacillus sp. OV219 TaxID=1884377 RepID=UPI0008B3436B|nr:NAD(P)H-dependent oxidoreductase [Paenibacillus sp. OV219]SEN53440.1 Putative NADPH-quinone reductase (modulator of drug activity B) [Paenibacillus sp. OV219]